jgi:hypothetical protein
MHEAYLKQHRNNLLLVSCGTALGTLVKMDIQPDFHVEMERPTFVRDALNLGSTQAQRKGITLLGLHTLSPETIKCFDEACLAIKPNDGGSQLVEDFLQGQKPSLLPFCNPTVSNCALSFLAAMGFEDIHLVGVDLGAPTSDQHHSEKSVYAHWNKFETEEEVASRKMDIVREGNFGGTVVALPVLDMSRVSMERLLEIMVQNFPNFRCYNTNNGAKIKHTVSSLLEELEAPAEIDKDREIQSLKQEYFFTPDTENLDEDQAEKRLEYFLNIKDKIKLNEDIQTDQALMQDMTRAFLAVNRSRDETAHYFLRGTLSCFFGAIVQHSLYCKNKFDFKQRALAGIRQYNQCIDDIFQYMEEHMLDIDDTTNVLLDRVLNDNKSK